MIYRFVLPVTITIVHSVHGRIIIPLLSCRFGFGENQFLDNIVVVLCLHPLYRYNRKMEQMFSVTVTCIENNSWTIRRAYIKHWFWYYIFLLPCVAENSWAVVLTKNWNSFHKKMDSVLSVLRKFNVVPIDISKAQCWSITRHKVTIIFIFIQLYS